ncbi:polyribonucleotide nucleotidyltransferase [Candidatus Oleimmundimicrobium sp.]|uniref:polyribonucleotide nucleotidyltransferase n=1 Tax=Candidatus Oleimmundimicrobium sp. TaxID=3060597 RepID=UPI00271B53F5|nr:polyribonucleotide nucleotidyltransferase [Candidatus Oleimmundimicrobium sp.]MDO8885442.1 polyribonucleotide nucleotidyltransferase [Candidatus Oleimmundimicrobium sp.]
MNIVEKELNVGGRVFEFQFGKVARQADGSVLVQCGDTIVLVTAVASKEPLEGLNFLPLTIDVVEKMYAAGKIPGGFIKREGRPSERSILTARLIDRPIRPLFPEGFRNEIQIIATILSVDNVNPPDVLALNGASIALAISDIPVEKIIAAVRVGRVDGNWRINPTFQELGKSKLNLIVAGSKDSIVMVEAGAEEVDEETVLQALEEGHKAIKQFIKFIEEIQRELGKKKREIPLFNVTGEIETKAREEITEKIKEALINSDKLAREEAITSVKKDALEKVLDMFPDKEKDIKSVFKKIEKEEVRKMILDKGIRPDGRELDEIRPISCEAGVLPRAHGSGLFTRGQTQALTVLTLGTVSEVQRLDGLEIEESKRFLHHYNFPPFCTGEIWRLMGPKRREIGHGALVEKAILPVLPNELDFPYAIRLVSEVLESNGSSSMASVCGSTLALMDAGVPINASVAGVAMGLVKEDDKVAVLTDIQGVEDALGDMDFKVAGTSNGVTALQMDMKVSGVDTAILKKALEQAKKGRLFILDKMISVISEPREELSKFAPRIITMKIKQEKIREVIGSGGKVIRGIIEETGANIDIEDDGTIYISSIDGESGEKARQIIELLVKEIKAGEVYMGTVVRIMNFGAFVEILPGKDGLVHISKLAKERIASVEDVVKVGDKILVKVIEIDKLGRINLSAIDVEENK